MSVMAIPRRHGRVSRVETGGVVAGRASFVMAGGLSAGGGAHASPETPMPPPLANLGKSVTASEPILPIDLRHRGQDSFILSRVPLAGSGLRFDLVSGLALQPIIRSDRRNCV